MQYKDMSGSGNLRSKDHWSLGGYLEGNTMLYLSSSDSLSWASHRLLSGEDHGLHGSLVWTSANV